MIIKSTLLAVIVFLSSLAVAEAEVMVKGPEMVNGADETTAAVTTGWNFVHAAACSEFFDGTTGWFYFLGLDGSFWFTNNLYFQNALTPACQTGNLTAFHVFNPSPILWDQIFMYPNK